MISFITAILPAAWLTRHAGPQCISGTDTWQRVNTGMPVKSPYFALFDLAEGKTYSFRVRCCNSAGVGESSVSTEEITVGDKLGETGISSSFTFCLILRQRIVSLLAVISRVSFLSSLFSQQICPQLRVIQWPSGTQTHRWWSLTGPLRMSDTWSATISNIARWAPMSGCLATTSLSSRPGTLPNTMLICGSSRSTTGWVSWYSYKALLYILKLC